MKLSWLPAVLILGLLPAWSAGQDAKPAKSAKPEVIEEFDVARDGDALILQGVVNGKAARFVLDTGASGCIFDRTLLRGKPQKTRDVFLPKGTAQLDLYEPPTARVGAQPLSFSGPVPGIDLQKLREVSGYEISAFLGMDFLRSKIVQIDFDRGKVLLLKALPADVGTPVNLIDGKGGLPEVWGKVDGWVQQTFLVDTGYVGLGCGLLSHDTFTGLTSAGSMTVVHQTLSLTAGGSARCEVGRARRLTLGDWAVAAPVFSDSGSNILCTGFLSRFVVTFDFPKNVMYLKQGQRPDGRNGPHEEETAVLGAVCARPNRGRIPRC